MAKIETKPSKSAPAAKQPVAPSKPPMKVVPTPPAAPAAKAEKAEGEKSDKKPRKKVPAFDRAFMRTARSAKSVEKAKNYFKALTNRLPEDHGGATLIKEIAEGIGEAATWMGQIMTQLASLPEGLEYPAVRAPRGSGGTASLILAGSSVNIRPKKMELYEGVFEDDEPRTLEVIKMVGGGKRALCKTSKGVRQVIPAVHLLPVSTEAAA